MSGRNYRAVAERALGRKLQPSEHVHHHSETQLVVCSKEYHLELHRKMRALGIRSPRLSFRSNMIWFQTTQDVLDRVTALAKADGRSRANFLSRLVRKELARMETAK